MGAYFVVEHSQNVLCRVSHRLSHHHHTLLCRILDTGRHSQVGAELNAQLVLHLQSRHIVVEPSLDVLFSEILLVNHKLSEVFVPISLHYPLGQLDVLSVGTLEAHPDVLDAVLEYWVVVGVQTEELALLFLLVHRSQLDQGSHLPALFALE